MGTERISSLVSYLPPSTSFHAFSAEDSQQTSSRTGSSFSELCAAKEEFHWSQVRHTKIFTLILGLGILESRAPPIECGKSFSD